MTKLINCFRDKKGSSFPLIIAITLALVIITVNDNYANVYHGVREGYSGGYLPVNSCRL